MSYAVVRAFAGVQYGNNSWRSSQPDAFLVKLSSNGNKYTSFRGVAPALNPADLPTPALPPMVPPTAMLMLPALIRITNTDYGNEAPPTDLVYGLYVGENFYILGKVRPGHFYIERLSRNLRTGYNGTTSQYAIGFMGVGQGCPFKVEVFEA